MNLEILIQVAKILPKLASIAQDAVVLINDPRVADIIRRVEEVAPELEALIKVLQKDKK